MSISTTTHLNFRGQARAALEFYQSVFGGELSAFTYEQAGRAQDATSADLLSWGQVQSTDGFRVMAYDVYPGQDFDPGTIPVFVSVRGTDPDEITKYWKGLSDGATVKEELAPAQWSPLYGMVTDKFGITWVLDVEVAW